MAETDIFPLEPDYALSQPWSEGIVRAVADSGRQLARLKRAPQRLFRLLLRRRPTSEKLQLEDWYRRFERDFFNWRHAVWQTKPDGTYLDRYFGVEFAGPPEIALIANEAYDMEVSLVEAIGRALYAYPDPVAGHPSAFQEETATTKTQGTWTSLPDSTAHADSEKQNANTNTTDFVLWVYAGYGFRLWARKGPTLGIAEVLLDDTSLGTVDLYAPSATGAQPVFTKLDVPLSLHRVKLRATNTKNASASGPTILADALEYLL